MYTYKTLMFYPLWLPSQQNSTPELHIQSVVFLCPKTQRTPLHQRDFKAPTLRRRESLPLDAVAHLRREERLGTLPRDDRRHNSRVWSLESVFSSGLGHHRSRYSRRHFDRADVQAETASQEWYAASCPLSRPAVFPWWYPDRETHESLRRLPVQNKDRAVIENARQNRSHVFLVINRQIPQNLGA